MTDIVPAAETGLPAFDRRSFLATLAAAGVLTGAALPAIAADHPDAELIELVAMLTAALARQRAYDIRADEAFQTAVLPEIPDAMCWREMDRYLVCLDVEQCSVYTIDGKDRPVYRSLDALTPWAQRYLSVGEAYANSRFTAADRARTREIKSALDTWEADVRRAEDIAGVTAPNDAANREDMLIRTLRLQIAGTRAQTVEGMMAKGSAAAGAWGNPESFMQSLLTKPELQWADLRDILSLSLIVDAMKLGAPAPATSVAADRNVA